MPATRPTAAFDITAYDAVGTDSAAAAGFVRHVALARTAVRGQTPAAGLPAAHMQPPLDLTGEATVHVHGTLPLSIEEQQAVERFVRDLDLEYTRLNSQPEQQYCVRPHTRNTTSPDGTVFLRRFSCVGFAVEAYRDARLEVVATDDASLPSVTLETLLLAYPDMARWLNSPAARARACGLPGDGPWPVLLPGHFFAALDAEADRIRSRPPYQPVSGDEFFPSRRPQLPTPDGSDQ